jgi:hypothetical protein
MLIDSTDVPAITGAPIAIEPGRAGRVCLVPHGGILIDLFARILDALRQQNVPVHHDVVTLGTLVHERIEPLIEQRGWTYRDVGPLVLAISAACSVDCVPTSC